MRRSRCFRRSRCRPDHPFPRTFLLLARETSCARTNTVRGNGRDRGSVTPLVLGMALCLLLFGAGIIAAGSAFLARQNLAGLCDAAATAAVNALPDLHLAQAESLGTAEEVATDYLRARRSDIALTATLAEGTVRLVCHRRAPVTFGVLFGRSTVDLSVVSVGRPVFDG
ncbi:hypothetical protein D1871_22380 [Nakamurella silvestris]|nr:hypothetical protein D1871_22380 [Nakamurella silvestris]